MLTWHLCKVLPIIWNNAIWFFWFWALWNDSYDSPISQNSFLNKIFSNYLSIYYLNKWKTLWSKNLNINYKKKKKKINWTISFCLLNDHSAHAQSVNVMYAAILCIKFMIVFNFGGKFFVSFKHLPFCTFHHVHFASWLTFVAY